MPQDVHVCERARVLLLVRLTVDAVRGVCARGLGGGGGLLSELRRSFRLPNVKFGRLRVGLRRRCASRSKTGRVVRDPRPLSPRPSHLHQRTRFIPPHLSPFSCACVPSLSFTHIRNVPTFVCRTSRTAAVGQPARPQRATAAVGPHTARIAAGGGRGRVSCGNGGLQQPISAATTATAATASTAAANGAAKADTNSLGRRPGRRG